MHVSMQGRFQKKIKGSSFVHGCGCHTPKAPPKLLLCEAEEGLAIGF